MRCFFFLNVSKLFYIFAAVLKHFNSYNINTAPNTADDTTLTRNSAYGDDRKERMAQETGAAALYNKVARQHEWTYGLRTALRTLNKATTER